MRIVKSLLTTAALFMVAQCTAQTGFTDITEASGLNHQYRVHEGLFGGGACVLDYDRDGFEDIYLTGGLVSDQLLHNNGDGSLTDVLDGSGLELTRHFVTQGVVSADVNRDGFADLFITTNTSRDSLQIIPRARNLLFLGRGDGTFEDATDAWGLTPLYSFSTGASFGDFNADGWPDLFVGNYFVGYDEKLDKISDATIVGATQTAKSYLLINRGGKYFEDVSEDYGLHHTGFGFGGVWTDYDNDGDQDLLVNHDFGYKATPNLLYQNQFPQPNFREVSEESGFDLRINSMGAAVGDYDQDGRLDYYISNIKFNPFLVAKEDGSGFTDRSRELGMTYVSISWGASFADYDQDGDLDLFVNNGDLNPSCKPMGNYYFEQSDGRFTERAAETGLADYGIGRGSVAFDLDNDGDLDLLTVCQNAALPDYPAPTISRLWRNDGARGNYLKIGLIGKDSAPEGIGSRVTVFAGGLSMIREVDGGSSSHLSQNSQLLHFGLGRIAVIDSVLVSWNGGHEQLLIDQLANQLLVITESDRPTGSTYQRSIVAACVALVGFLIFWIARKRRRNQGTSARAGK